MLPSLLPCFVSCYFASLLRFLLPCFDASLLVTLLPCFASCYLASLLRFLLPCCVPCFPASFLASFLPGCASCYLFSLLPSSLASFLASLLRFLLPCFLSSLLNLVHDDDKATNRTPIYANVFTWTRNPHIVHVSVFHAVLMHRPGQF